MPLAIGWELSPGPTSSQSLSENHVSQITPFRQLDKLERSSEDIVVVDSFSGRNYTLAELCTCTDYSTPLVGQTSFFGMPSGALYSTPSEEVRCVRCNLVRPYRITSVSM